MLQISNANQELQLLAHISPSYPSKRKVHKDQT